MCRTQTFVCALSDRQLFWDGGETSQFIALELFGEQNSIKKTRGNKIFRLWKSSGSVGRSWDSLSGLPWSKLLSALPWLQNQQWVGPVPEGGGLLLHKDLLWDCGGLLRSTSCPAGSGPGLFVRPSQLGPLCSSSKLRPPDAPDSPAQVQFQLWTRTEQAQSTQPVSPQQLLADPLWASLPGGCYSPGTRLKCNYHNSQFLNGKSSNMLAAT